MAYIDLKMLNKYAVKRCRDYLELNVYGKQVVTPYYINNIQPEFIELMRESGINEELAKKVSEKYKNKLVPYGWYRGKGTPEQLSRSAETLSDRVGLSLKNATKNGVGEFMKLYGLGIDCSGFVYNLLEYAFHKTSLGNEFEASLDWRDEKKMGANYAGTFVFAGKASNPITVDQARPLDLVFIKDKSKHLHMGIFLFFDRLGLCLAQSSLVTIPSGVTRTSFRVRNKKPVFGFRPSIGSMWERLYQKGILEVRRLKIVD
ncbi:hypothetical protein A2982_01730 [candidate division WWE3 bacterium RIFCSPLOWO2_01_FULL_39_13]|uniref:NlpC/P60 domain-containing protein n=1 Tax=candidate division WWE3 bacterium RIFCSPLOWO2_01_FULL_39_13 TaxID=1802624 RepID=A0A1F4V518_UNCKA|nr:MAG: hypothetical protein A2982_01730 [candidate division WWE3 bacterium RIFCSPLOWO2_01_FULL_39_13]